LVCWGTHFRGGVCGDIDKKKMVKYIARHEGDLVSNV